MRARFEELVGKTIVEVRGDQGDDRLELQCSDGSRYAMFHSQDCCETVDIYDICGAIADIIGSPVVRAEEVESEETPGDVEQKYQPESQTWTFYKIDTNKGGVTIRWLGISNGYYSERVDFVRLLP